MGWSNMEEETPKQEKQNIQNENNELKKVTVDGRTIKLTPTEYNILKFLTQNKLDSGQINICRLPKYQVFYF